MSEEQVAEAIRPHDEGRKIWAGMRRPAAAGVLGVGYRLTARLAGPGRECRRSLAQPLQTAGADLPNPAVEVFAHGVDSL
jgi:hypothetical protein